MVFSDYMNSLSSERMSEKGRKVKELAEAVCKSEVVIYNWIGGRSTPNKLERKTISGVLNIPEEELFPDAK